MKRFIKSAMCIALCSIVAIATCNAENKFKPIKSLPEGKKALRWQQQLKYCVDACEIIFPELQLVAWREAGTLNNQSEMDNFLKEGVAMDRMYGYTIYDENRRPKEYEVLPLSELMQKDDMSKNITFENLKNMYGENLLGTKVLELKWNYKGKEILEKIAVTEKLNNIGGGVLFSTIMEGFAIEGGKIPPTDWQIADEYRSMSEIDVDQYDKIDDDYWKTRFDHAMKREYANGLKLLGYKLIGVAKNEQFKNKYFIRCMSDDAYIMWAEHNQETTYYISKRGEVKESDPELYELHNHFTKRSIRSVKLGYDKIVRLKWEYNGKKFDSYAFVTSYVRKMQGEKDGDKSFYLAHDNIMKTLLTKHLQMGNSWYSKGSNTPAGIPPTTHINYLICD